MARSVKYSREYVKEETVNIDMSFITGYLPTAPENAAIVYLYGLAAAKLDKTIEEIAADLYMDPEDVKKRFEYWADQGLIRVISENPFYVEYLPVWMGSRSNKKYKPEKYAWFTGELQDIFKDRQLMPNHILGFIDVMETYKIEQEAMLAIAKYCKGYKGDGVYVNYILTVAREWASRDIRTLKQVDEHLRELEITSGNMREVFAALKLKSEPNLEDKFVYEKWKKSWGYDHESILYAASTIKRGGMTKLDNLLDTFYRNGIFTELGMREYVENHRKNLNLARKVVTNIGLYYENLEPVLDNYIANWLNKGFDADAIILVSKYAFIRNIRTLDQISSVMDRFSKEGLITAEQINDYIDKSIADDKRIKHMLEIAGVNRRVVEADRRYYSAWVNEWGFTDDVIECAAKTAVNKTHPFAFMNAVLARWKKDGVTTAAAAEAMSASMPPDRENKKKQKKFANEREYTSEELDAIFTVSEDIDSYKSLLD